MTDRSALVFRYSTIGAHRAHLLRDFGWTVTVWEPDCVAQMAAVTDGFAVDPLDTFPISRAERADVAFICSPPIEHAAHAMACLQHGCHVFIENPIAPTLQAAHDIVQAHNASDQHVMVGCRYRFWNGFRLKPERLDRIEISMRYRRPADWPLGLGADRAAVQESVVLEAGPHAIDLARYLVGPVKRLYHTTTHRIGCGAAEDAARIHLQHKNGIETVIFLDRVSKRREHQVRFFTRHGHRWVSGLRDGTDQLMKETRSFLRMVTRVPISSKPPNGPEEATETLRWCLEARHLVRTQWPNKHIKRRRLLKARKIVR